MDRNLQELSRLNSAYIDSVAQSNAKAFETLLADDFLCANPDGTLVTKPEFLRQIDAAPPFTSIDVDDLRIRMMGDIAIVHGRTSFLRPDGKRGSGRYTDVWAKRDGRWQAVSAHVTRAI